MFLDYKLSISNIPRPLTAGPIRNAENIESPLGTIQLCSITVAIQYCNKPLSVDGVVNPKSSSKGLGVVSVSFSSGRALCISTKLLKTNRVTTERIISP